MQKVTAPPFRDPSKAAAKWKAVEELAKSAIDLNRANLRLRATSVKNETTWDTALRPRPTEFGPSPKKIKSISVSAAKHQLKQHDLVRVQMNRWWEMIARSSGAATTDAQSVAVAFPLYVELHLRLYKALMPLGPTGTFKHKEARAEAERGWQADCPRGARSISRPIFENVLFAMVDQRTTSTTGEECAALLDALFDAIATGNPPSMRDLDDVAWRDLPAEAAWVASKAIGQAATEVEQQRATIAKGVGPYGVLRSLKELHGPLLPGREDKGAAGAKGGDGKGMATVAKQPPTASVTSSTTAATATEGGASREMPYAFDSHGSLFVLGIRPLTSDDCHLDALSWRPEDGPPPPSAEERLGAKRVQRLSITMSTNKMSHIDSPELGNPPPPRPQTVSSFGAASTGNLGAFRSPRTKRTGVVLRPISQPSPVPVGEWAAAAAGTASPSASGLAPRSPRNFDSPRYLEIFRDAERRRETLGGPDVVPRPQTVAFKATPMRAPKADLFAEQEAALNAANMVLANVATRPVIDGVAKRPGNAP